MAKEQKYLDGFNMLSLKLFVKSVSITEIHRYWNLLLVGEELYTISPRCKTRLWREFWGILRKKISSTIGFSRRLDITLLKSKILIVSKYNFNVFLSSGLGFGGGLLVKITPNAAFWHTIGHRHKTFWNIK